MPGLAAAAALRLRPAVLGIAKQVGVPPPSPGVDGLNAVGSTGAATVRHRDMLNADGKQMAEELLALLGLRILEGRLGRGCHLKEKGIVVFEQIRDLNGRDPITPV